MVDPRSWTLGVAVAISATLAIAAPTARAIEPDDCLLDDPARYRAFIDAARAASVDGKRVSAAELIEAAAPCTDDVDPQAFGREIALPMPCGRQMLFRRVDAPGGDPLAHEVAYFGDLDAAAGGEAAQLSAAPWEAAVAGAFQRPDGQSAYYIGKYEVSALQWSLFSEGLLDQAPGETGPDSATCADHRERFVQASGRRGLKPTSILPAGGIDWFQAIAFSKAWSNWLIAHDAARIADGLPPATPWRDGSTGFVRPPTEAEWEYAARGAYATREARAKRLPDVADADGGPRRQPEGLQEIAYLEDARSRGLTGGIGGRAPNALGLYDMIGNVEEIVLDLFRLVRPDGLHGRAGGYVARGGSSLTPTATLGVGARREIALVSAAGGNARVTGLRMVVSAPVFAAARPEDGAWTGGEIDPGFTAAALAARARLAEATTAPGARGDLISDLQRLKADADAAGAEQQALAARLAELQRALERSNAEIAQAQLNALRDRAVSAMAVAWAVRQTGQRLYLAQRELERAVAEAKAAGGSRGKRRELIADYQAAVRRIDSELNAQFEIYLGGVQDLGALSEERLDEVLAAAAGAAASRGADAFGAAPKWVDDHARRARTAGAAIDERLRKSLLYEVDEFRERRIKRFGVVK